jgi:hypothetical protein
MVKYTIFAPDFIPDDEPLSPYIDLGFEFQRFNQTQVEPLNQVTIGFESLDQVATFFNDWMGVVHKDSIRLLYHRSRLAKKG